MLGKAYFVQTGFFALAPVLTACWTTRLFWKGETLFVRLAAPKSADVLDGVGALFLLGRAGQNTDSQNDYITWMIG